MAGLAIWDLSTDPEPPVSASSPPPPKEDPCPRERDDKPHPSKFTDHASPYGGPAPRPVNVVNVTGVSEMNEPEFTLNGTDSCPGNIEYVEGSYPSDTPRFVRDEDLVNALRPFVAP